MEVNPHTNPVMLARVLGYDVQDIYGVLADISAEELREALAAALARSWPAGPVRTETAVYAAGTCSEALESVEPAIRDDRAAGRVPLLIAIDVADPAEARLCLPDLQKLASREGVWLHANCAATHGLEFEGLSHADSVSFRVPDSGGGWRRVFATRHPRVLDERFREALQQRAEQG